MSQLNSQQDQLLQQLLQQQQPQRQNPVPLASNLAAIFGGLGGVTTAQSAFDTIAQNNLTNAEFARQNDQLKLQLLRTKIGAISGVQEGRSVRKGRAAETKRTTQISEDFDLGVAVRASQRKNIIAENDLFEKQIAAKEKRIEAGESIEDIEREILQIKLQGLRNIAKLKEADIAAINAETDLDKKAQMTEDFLNPSKSGAKPVNMFDKLAETEPAFAALVKNIKGIIGKSAQTVGTFLMGNPNSTVEMRKGLFRAEMVINEVAAVEGAVGSNEEGVERVLTEAGEKLAAPSIINYLADPKLLRDLGVDQHNRLIEFYQDEFHAEIFKDPATVGATFRKENTRLNLKEAVSNRLRKKKRRAANISEPKGQTKRQIQQQITEADIEKNRLRIPTGPTPLP